MLVQFQIRHWGFDSTHWWRYISVSADQDNHEFYSKLLEGLRKSKGKHLPKVKFQTIDQISIAISLMNIFTELQTSC